MLTALYAELSYFDGAHFQHIADLQDCERVARRREQCRAAVSRNRARSGQNFGRKS